MIKNKRNNCLRFDSDLLTKFCFDVNLGQQLGSSH